jgi:gliding motility-associated-like protein
LRFRSILKFLFLLLPAASLHGQKQNNQWRFGGGAAVDFNGSRPVGLPASRIQSIQGTSAADRKTGALLFYSDGITVWDAQNNPMPNGTGLLGTRSVYQCGQVVPHPGNPNQYYLFNTGSPTQGFSYNLIDMQLRGGLGDVLPGQKNVSLGVFANGRIQSVPTCDRQGYWVIIWENKTSRILAFRVTAAGVDPNPVVSDVDVLVGGIGAMKINQQLNRLVISNPVSIMLFDFNNGTGRISSAMSEFRLPPPPPNLSPKFPGDPDSDIYGVEFSSDGRLLYAVEGQFVYQVNLSLPLQQAGSAAIKIVKAQGKMSYAALQRAANGKIYEGTTLGVINNPDVAGTGCGFLRRSGLYSGSAESMPNWIFDNSEGIITVADTCAGSNTRFAITDTLQVVSVDWDFGDGSPAGSGIRATHVYAQPGTYTVQATINRSCGASQVLQRVLHAADCCSMPNSPYVDFNYGPGIVCSSQGFVQPVTGSGFAAGGTFTSNTAVDLSGATGLINAPLSIAGTYTVTYTVKPPACPVPLSGTANISIKPSPAAPAVVSPLAICQYDTVPQFSVQGSGLQWFEDPADSSHTSVPPVVDSALPANFTVYVAQTGANGCRSTLVPIDVAVWPQPEIYAGGPRQRIDVGSSITLAATASSGASLLWQPGGFTNLQPLVAPRISTTYILTGTGAHGCKASDSVRVIVSFTPKVPNVFTPNGDGVNDNWVIPYLDTYPDLKLEVFSRWGQSVYSWQDGHRFWDGYGNGMPLPTGTYYWLIDPGEGLPLLKGFVDLIR